MTVETVKTYRIIHHEMRVGDEVRRYGDLIPEAADFANLRSYLNTDQIEIVFIPKDQLDKWHEDHAKKAKSKKVKEDADNSDPDSGSGSSYSGDSKKTVTKKRTVKKAATKGKGKNNGKLAEQPV